MDIATFRILRSAFNDPSRYPDGLVKHYLALAASNLDMRRWGTWLEEGTCDFVSHYLVIADRNRQASERGGTPGNSAGRVTGKSVGGVSVSFDTGGTSIEKGGQWNLTTYGVAYYQRALMVGTGGVQITGYGDWNDGGAWPGPWEYNAGINNA